MDSGTPDLLQQIFHRLDVVDDVAADVRGLKTDVRDLKADVGDIKRSEGSHRAAR